HGAPEGAGDGGLETSERFHLALAGGAQPEVVVLARALQAGLGDGDAVDGTVQLAVSASVQAYMTCGAAGPDRDRSAPGEHHVFAGGGEAIDSGGFAQYLGRGQLGAAGDLQQLRG